jgi:phospho-N-acetylmuramoyl-pentapeptide-transferase
MFYYLFLYLDKLDVPGAGLFRYISFRSGLALITSLIISMWVGKKIIAYLRKKQIGETVRNLGLQGEQQKQGTPTMGGIIIIFSIVIPVLLFSDIANIYIILMLVTTLWLGTIGFIDDYIKVFKKNKKGLAGKFKVLGQVGLGVLIGAAFYFSDDVVIKIKKDNIKQTTYVAEDIKSFNDSYNKPGYVTVKSTKTTLPFIKNNEFDYKWLISFLPESVQKQWVWLVFILVVIFIIAGVSNGANLNDGLDGLAAGTSSIIGATLGVFAYVSGNIIFSDYLNIMYIPHVGELVIFASTFIGATVGFLWYNSYPAQIFMGDTGSLTIGGIIAVFAIIVRKELLLPLLAGIFFLESVSVMLQVSYFKYTKRKYGEGKRIFLMSPLHHHYQKKGIHENKVVVRFWIVAIFFAVLTVITLKIR